MGIFNQFYPNQRWNSTTNSLETYIQDPSPSIFSTSDEFNDTIAQYGLNNQTAADPNAIVNPLGIVYMLQYYVSFLVAVLTSSMLSQVLTPFIGAQFAGVIAFILNLSMVLVFIRILTGRLRWS